jgi:hypothetical protein
MLFTTEGLSPFMIMHDMAVKEGVDEATADASPRTHTTTIILAPTSALHMHIHIQPYLQLAQ